MKLKSLALSLLIALTSAGVLHAQSRQEPERNPSEGYDTELARDMLERVERIVFIDSIEVPVSQIYQAIVLSPDAGQLFADAADRQGFVSSDKRLRYTVSGDSASSVIAEQTLLLSGEYDAPQPIMDGDDAQFPFMMPDGCTFYFASQRPGGLGGLDLYRSNRDSEDGTFLGAVNMGLPYNSPANDYFLAIDEYTGTGWLATDRNNPDSGMVTIYTFIPNEVRVNYPPDTSDLLSLARIDNIAATQPEGSDYEPLLARLDELAEMKPAQEAPYSFTMPDGRVITDFRDAGTLASMRQYLADKRALAELQSNLEVKRRRYAATPSSTLSEEILRAEREEDAMRRSVRQQQQAIIVKLTDN